MAASKPSRFGAAFSHPLNWLMLAGAGVSALLTGTWIPLAVAGGVEVVWLLVGSRFAGPRRYYEALLRDQQSSSDTRDEQTMLRGVSEADRRRFIEVDRLRQDIRRLATENPSLSMEMMRGELTKVDHLAEAFLRIANETARLEAFVEDSNLDDLEADVRTQRAVVEKTTDADAKSVAAQNLDLMEARLERSAEMRRRVRAARGQLNLVENTMALLRDQVVTMQTPQEIAGRLDDLVATVDVIEASAKEAEAVGGARAQRIAEH